MSAPVSARPSLGRDLLIVLSLANVMVVRVWAEMLDPSTSYFLDEGRPWTAYAGAILVPIFLAALGLPFALLARRSANRWVKRACEFVFYAGISVAIHGVRREIGDVVGAAEEGWLHQGISFASGLLPFLVLLPDAPRAKVRRVLMTGALVLSPFVLVTFGQTASAALRAADETPDLVDRPNARRSAPPIPSTRPRVVVVLFDGWDQFFTFEDRKEGLALPAIDKLQSESLHYARAVSPGTQTEVVMPSLFTGKKVVRTENAGASDRVLVFADGTRERFSDAPNLFQAAGAAGHDAGFAGWFHPYCRILGDDLAECHARALRPELAGMDLWQAFQRQFFLFLESAPHGRKIERTFFLERVRSLVDADQVMFTSPNWHVDSFEKIHAWSLTLASDPSLDLVFLHYPIPHPPMIWDAAKNDYMRKGKYEGMLALTDRTLAELRAALEGAGLADRTAIVALADHPHRAQKGLLATPLPSPRLKPGEPRPVPFLVRMPAGGAAAVIDTPIRTEALHGLVPEILAGRVKTNDDARAWLDANAR